MKITKTKLKQIIKEEVVKLLIEQDEYDDDYEEELTPAQKIIKLLTSPDPDNVNQGLTILDYLEDQQLINKIASHFTFVSKSSLITIQGFEVSNVTFWMILNYFAEKSARVKYMLAQIESLNITDDFITNVDFLRFCTNLTTLSLSYCSSLENVNGLEGCTNLTDLDLWRCDSLQNVNGLEGLTNLTTLDLSLCESLQNVDGLEGCTNLDWLNLSGCWSLQNVDGLQGLTNLTDLDLRGCKSLQNVDGLEGCTNLKTLYLRWCRLLPIKLQKFFTTDSRGTAYEKFIKALNASKGNQP